MKKIKSMLAIILMLSLSINTFGAVVSDNDGSAFITKAEFDALKNNFEGQIGNYTDSIDGKIDGAIASYLASLQKLKTNSLKSELNIVNETATQKQLVSNTFGKTWLGCTTQLPGGVSHYIMWEECAWNRYNKTGYVRGSILIGDAMSIAYGSGFYQPSATDRVTLKYAPAKFLNTKKVKIANVEYLSLSNRTLYGVNYLWNASGAGYHVAPALKSPLVNGNTLSVEAPANATMRYDDEDTTTHMLSWDQCQKTLTYTIKSTTTDAFTNGTDAINSLSYNLTGSSNYSVVATEEAQGIGYNANTIPGNLLTVLSDDMSKAWWDDTSAVGTNGYGQSTAQSSSTYEGNMISRLLGNNATMTTQITQQTYYYPIYRHKTTSIVSKNLINVEANDAASIVAPTYYYSGLPLVYCVEEGRIRFRLGAQAKGRNGAGLPSGTTWSGKLYFSDDRFTEGTTGSHIKNVDGDYITTGWEFSNETTEQEIQLFVDKGKEVWLKFIFDDITSDDVLVSFATPTNNIIQYIDS